jgi:hypothetical protein
MKKYRLNEALASYDTFLTKTNEAEMTSSIFDIDRKGISNN